MRVIEDLVTTTDSRVYRMLKRRYDLICDRCPPNRGENSNNNWFRLKNWKKFRKTQYKPKMEEL